MRKRWKLLLFGILAFLVILGIVLLMIPATQEQPENQRHIFLEPFFAKQFLQENPDYAISIDRSAISEVDINIGEVALSETGFSSNEFDLNGPTTVTVFNNSSKLRSFLVVSPGLDGNSYELSRFVLPPKSKVVLDFIIVPIVNDIVDLEGTKIRRTKQGILVFEIECLTGCKEGSDYLEIYANIG